MLFKAFLSESKAKTIQFCKNSEAAAALEESTYTTYLPWMAISIMFRFGSLSYQKLFLLQIPQS